MFVRIEPETGTDLANSHVQNFIYELVHNHPISFGKGENQGAPLEPRQGDSPAPLFRTALVTLQEPHQQH